MSVYQSAMTGFSKEGLHWQKTSAKSSCSHGIFVGEAIDNIDHNLNSTTAKSTIHWTGVLMFQYPDTTTEERKNVYSSQVNIRKENFQSATPRSGQLNMQTENHIIFQQAVRMFQITKKSVNG